MTTIECKNCGAKVTIPSNQTSAKCEYCGSIVTLPEIEPEYLSSAANIQSLLKRIALFLEDESWDNAKEYCEKVLDINPECAQAYLYRLMALCRIHKPQDLITRSREISEMSDYQKAFRFADPELRKMLEALSLDNLYYLAQTIMNTARTAAEYKKAAVKFKKISTWKDAEQQRKKCLELAELTEKNTNYDEAVSLIKETDLKISFVNEADRIAKLENAITLLTSVSGWKDADSMKDECEKRLTFSRELEKQDQLRRKKLDESKKQKALKVAIRKRHFKILIGIISSILFLLFCITTSTSKPRTYKKASQFLAAGEISEAAMTYASLGNYKDSREKSFELWEQILDRNTFVDEFYYSLRLYSNGTVDVFKNFNFDTQEFNVDNWSDIVEIAGGDSHIVGLRADGTVIAAGYDFYYGDAESWKNIVSIASGHSHVVGLKSNGRVVAGGFSNSSYADVWKWKDIVAIYAKDDYTVGLKSDGTILVAGELYGKTIKSWDTRSNPQ